MNGEMLAWLSVGLTAVVLAVVWLRVRPGSAGEAMSQVQEAAEFARAAVMAAEQLWRTGQLAQDERLDYVMDRLTAEFAWLDEERARMTVEAAVYWLKFVLPAASAAAGGPASTAGVRWRGG